MRLRSISSQHTQHTDKRKRWMLHHLGSCWLLAHTVTPLHAPLSLPRDLLVSIRATRGPSQLPAQAQTHCHWSANPGVLMVVLRLSGPPYTFLPFLVPESVRASKEPLPPVLRGGEELQTRIVSGRLHWSAYFWGLTPPGIRGPDPPGTPNSWFLGQLTPRSRSLFYSGTWPWFQKQREDSGERQNPSSPGLLEPAW